MVKNNKNKSKNSQNNKGNSTTSKIFTLPCQVKFRIVTPPKDLDDDFNDGEIYAKIEGATCDKWQRNLPRILDDNSIYKGIIKRKEIEDKVAKSFDSSSSGIKTNNKPKNGFKSSKKLFKKDSLKSSSSEGYFVKNIHTTSTPRNSVHVNSSSKSDERRIYYPTPVFKLICTDCERHVDKDNNIVEKPTETERKHEISKDINKKIANLNEKFKHLQTRADDVLKRSISRYTEKRTTNKNLEECIRKKTEDVFYGDKTYEEDNREFIYLSPRLLNESPNKSAQIPVISAENQSSFGGSNSSYARKKDKSFNLANAKSTRHTNKSKDSEWFGLLPDESVPKVAVNSQFTKLPETHQPENQVLITKIPLNDNPRSNPGKYKSAQSRHPKYYAKRELKSKSRKKEGLALSDELLPSWAKKLHTSKSRAESLTEETENDLYEIAVSVSFSSDDSCERCKWPVWASHR